MDPMDCPLRITRQFLNAYAVLSFLPYLARVELQDAESPAPNMRIQPSIRGRTSSLLSHEAIQPTFCTQCSVSCVGNRGSHPTVATYASADHKFNAEPSSPLSLHHRWMCPLWVKSRDDAAQKPISVQSRARLAFCASYLGRFQAGALNMRQPTDRNL